MWGGDLLFIGWNTDGLFGLCELVYCGDIFDGQLHGNNDSQLRGVLCGDVCGQRWQSDRLQELYIRMCSWIIFGGKLHGQRHGGV